MLPGTSVQMAEALQPSAPVGGRSPGLCSVSDSALSRAWTCPPRCAWQRTPWSTLFVSHAYHADQVQAAIGVPVTTSVESVPDHLSRGRFDGRDSAEAGERGLTLQALWVVFKATLSSVAAWSVPMPGRAVSSGAASATSRSNCSSSWAISSERSW